MKKVLIIFASLAFTLASFVVILHENASSKHPASVAVSAKKQG